MKRIRNSIRVSILAALALVFAACSVPGGGRLAEMPLSDTPLTGKIIWHDLITNDVDQAKRFYSGVLGWTFEQTRHPNGGDYTVIFAGERYVAGIVQLDDPSNAEYSRWLPYLSVADVDRAAEFTREEGGSVVAGPLDLQGVGRAAAIQDPQQAVIGLLRSNHGDPDDSLQGGPGLVVWNELLAANDMAAVRFYSALAGLQGVEQPRPNGIYHVLVSQQQERAGVMQKPADDVEPFWLTHFAVSDVNAATIKAAELGGQVILAPDSAFRSGLQSVIVDPTGAIFALRQWTE
jgi:predicted enzyme related to lactoylglutathione lyase